MKEGHTKETQRSERMLRQKREIYNSVDLLYDRFIVVP